VSFSGLFRTRRIEAPDRSGRVDLNVGSLSNPLPPGCVSLHRRTCSADRVSCPRWSADEAVPRPHSSSALLPGFFRAGILEYLHLAGCCVNRGRVHGDGPTLWPATCPRRAVPLTAASSFWIEGPRWLDTRLLSDEARRRAVAARPCDDAFRPRSLYSPLNFSPAWFLIYRPGCDRRRHPPSRRALLERQRPRR